MTVEATMPATVVSAAATGTSTTNTTSIVRGDGDRGQLPDLSDLADDATAKPEPARPARHQPVHPAAGAVRRRRAATQIQRSAEIPDRDLKRARRQRRHWSLSATPLPSTAAPPVRPTSGDLEFSICKGPRPPDDLRSPIRPGQTVYSGNYEVKAGAIPVSSGTAKAMTASQWPAGTYTLTATGKDARATASRSPPKSRASSVRSISPQSPPLLSIGGQSYTTDKIKRVVRSAAYAAS